MTNTMIGVVSPRDGSTAVVDLTSANDGCPRAALNGHTLHLGDYLSRCPSSGFVEINDPDALQRQFAIATEQSHTLDFTIMLLDAELSRELRRDIAIELDRLLKNQGNREYVLDIILGHPVADSSVLVDAAQLVKGFQQASKLIATIADCQERARHAWNAWMDIRKDPLVQQAGEARVKGSLLRTGLWRRIVCDCTTRAEVDRTKGELAVFVQDDVDARIVQRFAHAYSQELPPGHQHGLGSTGKQLASTSEGGSDGFWADELSVSDAGVATPRNSHVLYERAVKEVEKIADLFVKGNDLQAQRFLDELVNRQSQEHDHTPVVKSLCNVASRCATGGRSDVALKCLLKAIQYHKGIDFLLFMQMSNLFKDLRQFDRATECLEKARECARSPDDCDSVNRDLSRLLTAKGRYEEALESFQQLSDIDSSPQSRTSMATVMRKLGRLTDARNIYESVWSSQQGYYPAFVGLAEVNRQTGRFGKAIKKYQFLIQQNELDERQLKVYRSALSSLYRASGSFVESRQILNELLEQFPHDGGLKISLAKVLRLLGETDQADELYKQSFEKLHETEKLAALLYETAIVGLQGAASLKPPEKLGVMPEFDELATCNSMLRHIIAGNPARALEEEPPRVRAYRQHADFYAVLRYHARRMTDAGCNPKSDVVVNRLRKRGCREMKMAVHAIDRGELNTASECERRLCLAMV